MGSSGYRTKSPNREAYRKLVYRNIDYFLATALNDDFDTFFTFADIIRKLDEATGVKFQARTLERYRKQCFDSVGETPLCKAGDDKWRLNLCYYSYAKIKPPKPRKYKIDLYG